MKKGLSNIEKKIIEQRASKVLKAFGYDDERDIYVDAITLARFFGFDVEEVTNLSATEDGCITVSKDRRERNIIVNDTRSVESKRFIIVHELGHYLLHYMGSGSFFKHRENIKGKSLEENDADYLAACLLMPEKSFVKQYEQLIKERYTYKGIVDMLQAKFRTPFESIERRIHEVCLKN